MNLSQKKVTKSVSMLEPQSHSNNITERDSEQNNFESQNPFEMASALSSNIDESQDLGSKRESVAGSTAAQ